MPGDFFMVSGGVVYLGMRDSLKKLLDRLKWVLPVILLTLLAFQATVFLILREGLNPELDEADAIVVFGTTVNEDGGVSRLLRWRLDEGYRLWEKGLSDRIFVTGAVGDEGFDEAAIMKQYLIAKAIIHDSEGDTTYLSVKNSSKYLQENNLQSVIVVSDYAHIYRITATYNRFGVDEVYDSYSDAPMLSDMVYISQEVTKLIGYQTYDY
jgi:vancomycin permeability regulator SanA